MDSLFRFIPEFKGKHRLARFLLKKDLEARTDIWIRGKYGSSYLLPNLVENVALDIFINGIYEKGTSDLLAARLPRNGVLLDLGANIGAVCIPVAAKRKDISIVAVEAAPWLFGY